MAMHEYHPSLPGYDPDAIIHDGCEECEARAAKGVGGLLELDDNNIDLLWRRVLNTEYGGETERNDAGRYRSDCEARLGHHLYLIGILLERSGERAWHLDRFSPERKSPEKDAQALDRIAEILRRSPWPGGADFLVWVEGIVKSTGRLS